MFLWKEFFINWLFIPRKHLFQKWSLDIFMDDEPLFVPHHLDLRNKIFHSHISTSHFLPSIPSQVVLLTICRLFVPLLFLLFVYQKLQGKNLLSRRKSLLGCTKTLWKCFWKIFTIVVKKAWYSERNQFTDWNCHKNYEREGYLWIMPQ